MRPEILSSEEYRQGILAGNSVILGRAITLIESQLEPDRELATNLVKSLLPQTGLAIRVGISGAPGVGKSTFIEALGRQLTSLKKKVAVLAVDPSSSKTKGSILGDKTRMEELSKDPLAFVRPSAASGQLGGVTVKTREVILLCEAAGYEVILVETVGVGQSEVAVRGMVDFFLLLMLAGAGDELQGIKKGIIEMADGIAINKADGDNLKNVKRAQADLQHALHFLAPSDSGWSPRVLACSAVTKEGIDEIWNMVSAFISFNEHQGFLQENRKRQNQLWMEESLKEIMEGVQRNSAHFQQRRKEFEQAVRDLNIYPPEAGRMLWDELLKNWK